jgi:hypothetical protein
MQVGEPYLLYIINMKELYTTNEFNIAKSRQLLPLQCEQCEEIFYLTKHAIQTKQKNYNRGACFCSKKCQNQSQTKDKIIVKCLNCNKLFEKPAFQIKNSPNHFCCHSCHATYSNTHKTTGYRRSKLEIYLEEQIEQYYPQLGCLYNNKETIGSELDFYFSTLKLAIELNGIFHYEPIYGQDKLEKIQNNDEQKSMKCNELGIEFCNIDSSSCKNLTQKQKDKYWDIIKSILDKIINRHKMSIT